MMNRTVLHRSCSYQPYSIESALEEATAVANSVLAERGIKPVEIITEELEDEVSSWVGRIFYIDRSVREVTRLNVQLVDKLIEKGCKESSEENVVVMFMTAGK